MRFLLFIHFLLIVSVEFIYWRKIRIKICGNFDQSKTLYCFFSFSSTVCLLCDGASESALWLVRSVTLFALSMIWLSLVSRDFSSHSNRSHCDWIEFRVAALSFASNKDYAMLWIMQMSIQCTQLPRKFRPKSNRVYPPKYIVRKCAYHDKEIMYISFKISSINMWPIPSILISIFGIFRRYYLSCDASDQCHLSNKEKLRANENKNTHDAVLSWC